jgi:integrase
VLARTCRRASLSGVTVHVLRHSFAAAAAEMGFSELTIAGPAVSQIRDWVGPAYRMISRSSAADRTAKETADNSSPKFAEAADG